MTDHLITLDALSAALGGRSRASIYRDVRRVPGFPQPVKLGSSTRFRQSDVDAFMEGLAGQTGEARQ